MTKEEFRELSTAKKIQFLNGYLGRTKSCDNENEFVWAFAVRNTPCKKVDNKYVELSAEELEELKKNEKPKQKKVKKEKEIDWVFFSPAADMAPGVRTGRYRLGKDDMVVDVVGNSHISVQDYAAAMIDELEKPAHHQERFTIGY